MVELKLDYERTVVVTWLGTFGLCSYTPISTRFLVVALQPHQREQCNSLRTAIIKHRQQMLAHTIEIFGNIIPEYEEKHFTGLSLLASLLVNPILF